MVPLVEVGVRLGKVGNGLVEDIRLSEIRADCDPVRSQEVAYRRPLGEKLRVRHVADALQATGVEALAHVYAGADGHGALHHDDRVARQVGGQLVHEKWNKDSQSGEYGVVIGDRFTVAVSGNAANIDELKGDKYLGKTFAQYERVGTLVHAISRVQEHLKCERLLKEIFLD